MKTNFLVDVGSLLRFEEQLLPLNVKVIVESFSIGGEEVEITSPVFFSGVARRLSKGIQIEGKIKAQVFLDCARCLEKFCFSIETAVKEFFALPAYQAQLPDELDYYLVQAEKIDLKPMIKELLALAIPFKALCSEDCLGLCPLCGKNLNQGLCSCQDNQLKVKSSASKKK